MITSFDIEGFGAITVRKSIKGIMPQFFTGDPAKAGTYFYSEIQFLLNNGYKIVDEGWRLIK